jgi:hypothetical protein
MRVDDVADNICQALPHRPASRDKQILPRHVIDTHSEPSLPESNSIALNPDRNRVCPRETVEGVG